MTRESRRKFPPIPEYDGNGAGTNASWPESHASGIFSG